MQRKDYLLLWVATLVVLLGSGVLFTQPGYMDAYYYYHVAANLAQGRGLVEDFVWTYFFPSLGIPLPSNLYWMPLTSLVAYPSLFLFGVSFRAAQIPFVLASSLVPLMAAWLAWSLGMERRNALAAGILTLLGGFYFIYWTLPDSFGLFLITVTLSLVLMYKAADGPFVRLFPPRSLHFAEGLASIGQRMYPFLMAGASGAMAALSHLARADGALLVLVMALFFAITLPRRRALALFAVGLGGYLLLMTPWLLRNWSLVGSLPAIGGLGTAFLREYDEFFSYGAAPSWRSFLDWGLGSILWSKVLALGENLKVFMGGELYLAPFAAVGLWAWRRERRLLPFFLYAATLYLALSLVFTFPGLRGSMVHSGVALLPWTAAAVIKGINVATEWAGSRRPHWDVPRAQGNFTLMAVFFSAAMSLAFFGYEVATRDQEYLKYSELASWFKDNTPPSAKGGLVMVTDPPAYSYAGGGPSVVTPTNGLDALLKAADAYGVTHLALEAAHARPLRGLYLGQETSPRLQPLATVGDTHIFLIKPH